MSGPCARYPLTLSLAKLPLWDQQNSCRLALFRHREPAFVHCRSGKNVPARTLFPLGALIRRGVGALIRRGGRLLMADTVAKVENRTTPKISRKSILRRRHCFYGRYEDRWPFLYELMWSLTSPRAKRISGL